MISTRTYFQSTTVKMKRRIVHCLILILFSLTSINGECEGSGIAPNKDTGKVTIKKGTTRKRTKTVEDIEITQVKWSPNIETNKDFFDPYDLSTLRLEFRTNGEWKSFVPKKNVEYTGYYVWNVPRIPCLEYEYQIAVSSKIGDKCFATTSVSLAPEDKETIRSSRFSPEPPTNLVINAQSNHAAIRWNKSKCAFLICGQSCHLV